MRQIIKNMNECPASMLLRDRPFLFPGTQAERIYENLKKNFIPHENTINIFRTPSKSGENFSSPPPLGLNYYNPPTVHCGTGLLISVPNDLQRKWTTICVSAIQLCVLHSDMR